MELFFFHIVCVNINIVSNERCEERKEFSFHLFPGIYPRNL
jgi:hypothetical protein